MHPIIAVIGSQLLFTIGDLMARSVMREHGFSVKTFIAPWFIAYFFVRTVAMFGQLYVFSAVPLGKTMALFSASSLILSNVLGFFLLKEILTIPGYIGVMLAVTAVLILAFK